MESIDPIEEIRNAILIGNNLEEQKTNVKNLVIEHDFNNEETLCYIFQACVPKDLERGILDTQDLIKCFMTKDLNDQLRLISLIEESCETCSTS